MQNQSRDSFPSDTEKNPKDCKTITLRSGRELKGSKETEKKQTEVETKKAYHNSTGFENRRNRTGLSDEIEHMK